MHRRYGEQLPTGHSTMHLYPIDGSAARVPDHATPFAYRHGGWAGVIVGVDPDPAHAALITDWATRYWRDLHPTSAGGAYVNFMMDEGTDRPRAAYLGNYDRLAQVKAQYDPDNLFHINQNVPPASRTAPPRLATPAVRQPDANGFVHRCQGCRSTTRLEGPAVSHLRRHARRLALVAAVATAAVGVAFSAIKPDSSATATVAAAHSSGGTQALLVPHAPKWN